MYRVEIRLSDPDQVADQMAAMRTWLDDQRFEPDLFNYEPNPDGVIFRVEFKIAEEAEALAEAFGGQIVPIR
jgi:hypothetical protein